MKPARSLKARALQWLAQREQSRVELRRKLLPHALKGAAGAGDASNTADAGAARATVEALLDWLEAHKYLSAERFVESRVHARAARFGNLRIRSELKQHALALPPDAVQALAATELDRATQLCERKFGALGTAPIEPAVRARQARFLAGRGFSPDTIRSVLRRTRAATADEAD
jgi:regulatory protein